MSDSSKDPKSSTPTSARARERKSDADWLREARSESPHEEHGPQPSPDRKPTGPRVMVCDEGELDDVVAQLMALGENPLRLRPADLEELREWERPSRLTVTSVRVALAASLPLADTPEGLSLIHI